MSAVILACDAILVHLRAAQEKLGTNLPVIEIDRKLHREPALMRAQLLELLASLPEEYDTILVAMGFCGGSWDTISPDRRLVIPRVDDCITMLLHTDEQWHANLKECGHMYLRDPDDYFDLDVMLQRMIDQYGEKKGNRLFRAFFHSYHHADIIDTGVYDCRSEEYLARAKMQAEMIHSELSTVPGSNILLEKLVSGRWDEQFVVVEPGQTIDNHMFV